jgi:hypothetical protein
MSTAEQAVAESKPVVVAEPQPLHSGFWDRFIGKQMVFQTKGHVLITGTLKEFRNMFLLIEASSVTGKKYTVKPREVLLDRNYISHFHEQCETEEISNENGASG